MEKAEKKRVLLINDMPGYGTIALSAMIPILNRMGYRTCTLPTALVSNTLGYGRFEILETTHYMERTIGLWEQLGFGFEAISTGFFASEKQVQMTVDFCKKQKEKGVTVFVDPVMGDDGQLYNGVGESMIASMHQMICVADYITPNYTEAAYLAGIPYSPDGLSEKDAEKMVALLAGMGAKSIVITSAVVEQKLCVIVYDGKNGAISYLPFERIPNSFVGSGDAFSAIFAGGILQGKSLEDSARFSMDVVKRFIEAGRNCGDPMEGILIENCLDEIKSR